MNQKLVQEFIEMICKKPPGYLASFNGSGFKIRNDYFGHTLVDKEIDCFSRLLNKKSNGVYKRVGGDEWISYFSANSLSKISESVNEFYDEKQYNAGWACLAERNGEIKTKKCIVKSKLLKAVRCVYSYTDRPSEAGDIVVSLVGNNWGLPPNTIHDISTLSGDDRKYFPIIEVLPVEPPSCPFCGAIDFDWVDGETSIYGAYGICKKCHAEVSIDHAERPPN